MGVDLTKQIADIVNAPNVPLSVQRDRLITLQRQYGDKLPESAQLQLQKTINEIQTTIYHHGETPPHDGPR